MTIEKIKTFELVELTINANVNGRFNFDTQPQLRNQGDQVIIIKGVQVYPLSTYSASQTNAGVPGIPNAEIPKAVLVLYINGQENVKMIPLGQLININDGTVPFQQEIQTFADLNNVAWEKSYVQFSAAAANTPYVIPFGVSYIRLQRSAADANKWIEAP